MSINDIKVGDIITCYAHDNMEVTYIGSAHVLMVSRGPGRIGTGKEYVREKDKMMGWKIVKELGLTVGEPTKTIKLKYARYPQVLESGVGTPYLVQRAAPFPNIPNVVWVPIHDGENSLRLEALKAYKADTLLLTDCEGYEWLKEVNEVELIECELLAEKEKTNENN